MGNHTVPGLFGGGPVCVNRPKNRGKWNISRHDSISTGKNVSQIEETAPNWRPDRRCCRWFFSSAISEVCVKCRALILRVDILTLIGNAIGNALMFAEMSDLKVEHFGDTFMGNQQNHQLCHSFSHNLLKLSLWNLLDLLFESFFTNP